MPTITETLCAWCEREAGTISSQQENDSHGICADHSNQVLGVYQAKRLAEVTREFDSVPSYTSRFADGREMF